jgi:hypothetical protein
MTNTQIIEKHRAALIAWVCAVGSAFVAVLVRFGGEDEYVSDPRVTASTILLIFAAAALVVATVLTVQAFSAGDGVDVAQPRPARTDELQRCAEAMTAAAQEWLQQAQRDLRKHTDPR